MDKLIAILNVVAALVPQLLALGQKAAEAVTTGDQATLDTLHQQALDAANALRPAGSDPLT